MKLLSSFIKELKLASRGYYFYVELFMAIILLLILLFVIPENFNSKSTEYVYFDLPKEVKEIYKNEILINDLDNKAEELEIEVDDEIINTTLFETSEKKIYIVNDEESLIKLAEDKKKLGAVITLDKNKELHYKYYLQGYESERLKKLYLVIHNKGSENLTENIENQQVKSLSNDYDLLNDRENVIPVFLAFNGSLMGLFIIAAYIFLDKQEGTIKAFVVTPSKVWEYLMSKVLVLLVTSIISSLIIVIPVMGLKPNYILLLILLITSGFFASSLGLVIASFYDNIMKAFGAIYIVIIAFIIPNIAYFVPSWEPIWIKIMPTYPLIQGFKETILKNSDSIYVLTVSLGFLMVGLALFLFADYRYKKTLA